MKYKKEKFYLVEKNALPEVFDKVIQVKDGIRKRKYPSINQAVKEIGISRSAYYKYRNSVFTYKGTDLEAVDLFNLIIEIDMISPQKVFYVFEKYSTVMLSIQQSPVAKGISSLQIICRKVPLPDTQKILSYLKKTHGILQVNHNAIRD